MVDAKLEEQISTDQLSCLWNTFGNRKEIDKQRNRCNATAGSNAGARLPGVQVSFKDPEETTC